jgi:hypothetical protein
VATNSGTGLALPDSACDTSQIPGDFDGDGSPDVAAVYFEAEVCAQSVNRQYVALVALGSGKAISIHLPECSPCSVFAAPDIDADGKTELVISVATGLPETLLSIWSVSNGSLIWLPFHEAPATVPGQPAPGYAPYISWGGTATYENNAVCSPGIGGIGVLVTTNALLSQDGTEWAVHEVTYTLEATDVVVKHVEESSVSVSDPAARLLAPGLQFCGADTLRP